MRVINSNQIIETVSTLCQEVNFSLSESMLMALERASGEEESDTGKKVFALLKKNAQIAEKERLALCQDCGLAVVFAEVGQDVSLEGIDFEEAIHQGVREGYRQGYLRKSVVRDPFDRTNTGDNTPAIIHSRIVPGDKITITVAAKGGGSENMSALKMFAPCDGLEGVMDFVVETVDKAGPNPCPPIVVGVGIGGNFEYAPLLAKRALLRPVGQPHPNKEIARVEKDLLERINALGIGPQGFGGRITALGVAVESAPCHIASLPAAVNIDCHCHRHKTQVI